MNTNCKLCENTIEIPELYTAMKCPVCGYSNCRVELPPKFTSFHGDGRKGEEQMKFKKRLVIGGLSAFIVGILSAAISCKFPEIATSVGIACGCFIGYLTVSNPEDKK